MAVQDFFSQLQSAMQQGGAKKRTKAARKPVGAVKPTVKPKAKPKAKPARLVNKQRLFHNKLMKHFGGFFESVDPVQTQNENFNDDKKKQAAVSPLPTDATKVGGAKKRVVRAVRAVPKKRRVGVRARSFRGGYEEGEEEFMSMDAFSQEESQSGGRKKRHSVARRPVARRPVVRR